MSFDKTYPNRKDRRKPYRGAKSVDAHCRNHGSCNYCRGNRTVKRRKSELALEEETKFFTDVVSQID
jgi:hypothetical protein